MMQLVILQRVMDSTGLTMTLSIFELLFSFTKSLCFVLTIAGFNHFVFLTFRDHEHNFIKTNNYLSHGKGTFCGFRQVIYTSSLQGSSTVQTNGAGIHWRCCQGIFYNILRRVVTLQGCRPA